MAESINRIRVLEDAIRKHRDQRGDDRCWLDDQELYAVLGEPQPNTRLVPKDLFLANCARFWECRQNPGQPYETEADRTKTLRTLLASSIRILGLWRKSWHTTDQHRAIELRVEAADKMLDLHLKARELDRSLVPEDI